MKAIWKYSWQLYRLWTTERDEYYYEQLRRTVHLSQFVSPEAAWQLSEYFGVVI